MVPQRGRIAEADLRGDPFHRPVAGLQQLLGAEHPLRGHPGVRGRAGLGSEPAGEGADLFTTDDRLKLLSFTGSPEVGWALKARAGKKKVVLELGGNAAVVIDADADLDDAVERTVFGAFYQSGQSCIGVQRILVHADIYDAFKAKLVAKTKTLIAGDPHDENTFVGPMISESEAKRLDSWIQEATARGATAPDLACRHPSSGLACRQATPLPRRSGQATPGL